jgi:LPS export ABC transporter protein LptC
MRNAWLFVLVVAVSIFGYGCSDDLKDPDKEIKYTGPLIENANITTLYSDSAKILIRLRAPVQQEFENGDGVFPKGLYVEFFREDGQITSTLKANYGKQERNKDLFLVKGNVVLENLEKQEKLETEELYWDKNKDRIYTDKFVKITTPERVLMGKGLETNQSFWPYKILNPTGIIELD